MLRRFCIVWLLLAVSAAQAVPAATTLKKTPQGWTLLRDGKPYFVRGVGGAGHLDLAVAIGANSVRTWGIEHAREVLDDAQKRGMTVMLGLWLDKEMDGFDYGDAARVQRQFETLKAAIDRFKDHPALLMWGIGNELDLHSTDPRVWDAVERLARYAHQVDPHHPVATVIAGVHAGPVAQIRQRAPDIDVLGVNSYGDVADVRGKLDAAGWRGPYLIAEWGVSGPWESPTTSWGVAIEPTSTQKRAMFEQRYAQAVAAQRDRCLGSYAFLWGSKQEYTETWFGLFAKDGTPTEPIDGLQRAFTGHYPPRRAAEVVALTIDGKNANDNVRLHPGQKISAELAARTPSSPTTRKVFAWKLLEESSDKKIGGAAERVPNEIPLRFEHGAESRVGFVAPAKPGAYRLFASVLVNGRLSYANLPFQVKP